MVYDEIPQPELDDNPLAGVDPEHVQFLTAWAAKHGATVAFAGTCGLGRECVGVLIGGAYLDYSHIYDLLDGDRWNLWWQPEDAYHKHDCMAVLGRGPDAVAQLYQWAKFLDEHGWSVAQEYRQPSSYLDGVFHGLSMPKLMPPSERS